MSYNYDIENERRSGLYYHIWSLFSNANWLGVSNEKAELFDNMFSEFDNFIEEHIIGHNYSSKLERDKASSYIIEDILDMMESEGLVTWEEEYVEHNHGPCPSSCYGPWHDVITECKELNFDNWDISKLQCFLEDFNKKTIKEKIEWWDNNF
jgi:hypothetical protein